MHKSNHKYVLLLLVFLPLAGIWIGWSINQNYHQTAQVKISKSVVANTSPTRTPPDLVSGEEECLTTFRGVRDYVSAADAAAHPIPTRIPSTTCIATYSEARLSFDYSCNIQVIPKVEKEISTTCGFIREFYLVEKISDESVGELSVYPAGASVGGKDTNTSGYTAAVLLQNNPDKSSFAYKDPKTGALVHFYSVRSDYQSEISAISTSIRIKY